MAKEATRAAYGKALAELVQENENVVVLDADLAGSTKTAEAKKVCPERHFDMGIAEGNMMAVAAGMAASHKIPYASAFAVFATGRAYDQIRNSICYPNLNVKVCATHAGLTVGEDGASHQSLEDIALMRALPNMKVFQPCDGVEARAIVKAVADIDGPCYVRLGRLAVDTVNDPDTYKYEFGKGIVMKKGAKVAIIATGMMVQEALKAAEQLDFDPTVININTIKPIDKDLIIETAKTHDAIVTVEEHNVIGGLGGAVAEVLADQKERCPQYMMGVKDEFGQSGTPAALLDAYGLDAAHIAEFIQKL
ncbi:transketolase family protein [Catenisphaera adipataccumulans]|uniref:Transketolase n=1 Tax=Catenisphaera adipataccumulans TaxID=700500 RepID=A0A7W8CXK3_9FIRM|nr:transketolase C-terminal domain-containing protein [Catenisphaera adipataccumulans]MBB5183463.1 transketolase [Catenisphaera adipataccumulans]